VYGFKNQYNNLQDFSMDNSKEKIVLLAKMEAKTDNLFAIYFMNLIL
jgi:hypothetical protein